MTWVGLVGILLALSAAYVADVRGSRRRFVVFVLLLVLHTLASAAFYLYSESSGSDAHFYYYDPLRYHGLLTGFGTAFIMDVVQYLKQNLGGSFFDYFMMFQALGFWGLVFVYKTFHEIFTEVEGYQSSWTYLPLFLPGLHFWTSAIGKDAPIFLAVAISIWATLRLKKRLPALGFAIAVMLAVRPHVALLALIALAVAALLDRRTGVLLKTLFLVGVLAGGIVVASSLQSNHSVDVSNADSVSDFMEARASVDESSGADRSIVDANMPVKVLSLWFRPFFLDAENIMGYIASLENAALLALFAFLAWNFRLVRTTFMSVLYVRYAAILFVALTAVLAAVNFNVGLGLRQKMMAMPCLLVILTTLLAIKSSQRELQRQSRQGQWQPGLSKSPAAYPGS